MSVVDAYLKRMGYAGPLKPNSNLLRDLHRAHLFAVPFENLDIAFGRKIICDEDAFLRKIIERHRGGFCYELNGAFAALLRSLGFQVSLLSARVPREDGSLSPEFDHLTLRVDLEEPWLADVGFGDCFLEPLRLRTGMEQPQNRRIYRLTSRLTPIDGVFDLEVMAEGRWRKEFAFTLQPHELSDFAGRCHYHQTSPESHFTRQRICSLPTPEGRLTLSDNKLIETRGASRQETPLSGGHEWQAKLR